MWLWPKQRSLRNTKVKYFFTGIIYDKDLLPFLRYSRIRKWLRNHRCIYDTKCRETLLLKQSDHQLSRMKIFSPRMQKNFHHHQVELTRYSMTRSFHISLSSIAIGSSSSLHPVSSINWPIYVGSRVIHPLLGLFYCAINARGISSFVAVVIYWLAGCGSRALHLWGGSSTICLRQCVAF